MLGSANIGAPRIHTRQACSIDAEALESAPHPPDLVALAGRDGLLEPDPKSRPTLAQLSQRLAVSDYRDDIHVHATPAESEQTSSTSREGVPAAAGQDVERV